MWECHNREAHEEIEKGRTRGKIVLQLVNMVRE